MKDISLRPKKQLMNLFEAVQKLDNLPGVNRSLIIDRALDIAIQNKNINWQSLTEVAVENNFNGKIPSHVVLKVDESKFLKVKLQIQATFGVEKVTIPYTIVLLLTLYFIHLKQQVDLLKQDSPISDLPKIAKKLNHLDFKVDTWVIKNRYEQSAYAKKQRLLSVCELLIKSDFEIKNQLISQNSASLQRLRDLVNLDKYFNVATTPTIPTTTTLAKILAGIFIVRVSNIVDVVSNRNQLLDQIVNQLEAEFLPLENSTNNVNSATYYKEVYAKMMGGKT